MEPTIALTRSYLGYSLYDLCTALHLDLVAWTDHNSITVFDTNKQAAEVIDLHELVSRVLTELEEAKAEVTETLTLGNALVVRAAECLKQHDSPFGEPPWANAQHWVRYMVPVVYSNGQVWWYAYENKPTHKVGGGYDHMNGRWSKIRGACNVNGVATLHKRPQVKEELSIE